MGLYENFESLLSYDNNYLLWNSHYLGIGMPTLANIDQGLVYPPNLVVVLLAKIIGDMYSIFGLYTIFAILHIVFGCIFVYAFLRYEFNLKIESSLIGSFMWAFCGYNTEFLSAAPILFSASYLPVVMYLRSKQKSGILLYVFYALSFIGGYPIAAMSVYIFSTLFYVFKTVRTKKWYFEFIKKEAVGILLVTLPIMAPVYITGLINLAQTGRSDKLSLSGFLSNSASVKNIVESVIPINTTFNDSSATYQVYLYFSLVGLLIIALNIKNILNIKGRPALFIFIGGFVGLLLSLGKWGFLPFLLYYIPGMNLFRRLSVFSLLPSYSFCILVSCIFNAGYEKVNKSKSLHYILVATFTFFIFLTMFIFFKLNLLNMYWFFVLTRLTGITFGIIYTYILMSSHRKISFTILIATLVFEAILNISSKFYLNSHSNPQDVFRENQAITYIKNSKKANSRVDIKDTQYSYSTDYLGLDQTYGYLALANKNAIKLDKVLSENKYLASNLLNILSVEYMLTPKKFDNKNLQNITSFDSNFYVYDYLKHSWVLDTNAYYLYKNDRYADRVYLASKFSYSDDEEQVLDTLSSQQNRFNVFIPSHYVFENLDLSGKLEIQQFTNNHIKLKIESDGPSYVVISNSPSTSWVGVCSGKVVWPIRTNLFMQGYYLSSGCVLDVFYVPLGIVISFLLIIIASLVYTKRVRAMFL